jgi:hypothetical protein
LLGRWSDAGKGLPLNTSDQRRIPQHEDTWTRRSERSGSTLTRPAWSVSAPSHRPAGEASTPPDNMIVLKETHRTDSKRLVQLRRAQSVRKSDQIARKSDASVRFANSAMAPVSSTPVAPPPTTTKWSMPTTFMPTGQSAGSGTKNSADDLIQFSHF